MAKPAGSNVGDVEPLTLDAARRPGRHAPAGRSSADAPAQRHGAGPGFGVHICDVEVDPETGNVTVVRYTAAQDVGKAIHPC